jgi:hypothetical protein
MVKVSIEFFLKSSSGNIHFQKVVELPREPKPKRWFSRGDTILVEIQEDGLSEKTKRFVEVVKAVTLGEGDQLSHYTVRPFRDSEKFFLQCTHSPDWDIYPKLIKVFPNGFPPPK